MKKSLTALAAPSLSTLHANADADLTGCGDDAWKVSDKSFDIQDAQNPGHLDLSANYKFAEGWTADPVLASPLDQAAPWKAPVLQCHRRHVRCDPRIRHRDAGPTRSLALMP